MLSEMLSVMDKYIYSCVHRVVWHEFHLHIVHSNCLFIDVLPSFCLSVSMFICPTPPSYIFVNFCVHQSKNQIKVLNQTAQNTEEGSILIF